MLEVALLLKEAGLVDPSGRSAINIVPLFETIEDLQAVRGDHGPAAVDARLPQAGGQPRRRAGSHARLFRQQQGWRLRHLGLGALQGRDRPGRGVRAPRRAAAAVPRPRRLGRPRRRAELRRHHRAARRRGERPDPHHRAGRDHLQQIFQRRSRPQQSGNSGRRDAGSEPAAAAAKRAAAEYLEAMDELSALAFKAYRGLVYETEALRIISGARPSSPKSPR